MLKPAGVAQPADSAISATEVSATNQLAKLPTRKYSVMSLAPP